VTNNFWLALGVLGSILFFGRFYVQWLVSEWRGEYVVPVAFWYMSMGGSLLLFAYAYDRQSPGGTLGLCLNVIIYTRNLVLIWREQGKLTPLLNRLTWTLAIAVSTAAALLTAFTWARGYQGTVEFWAWSAVWTVGQGCFFLRFGVQWLVTELRGKSTIPASFWHLSLMGLLLHGSYFLHRQDWLLAFGTIADGLPYARNLWLMKKSNQAGD